MGKRMAGLVLGGLLWHFSAAAQAAYEVRPFWDMNGVAAYNAVFNNAGQVAISVFLPGAVSTVRSGGTSVNLALPAGREVQVSAMNNAAQVVGSYVDSAPSTGGAIWNTSTGALLTTLNGPPTSEAGGVYFNDINDAGQAVGYFQSNATAVSQAYTWNGATAVRLASMKDEAASFASGINASGLIVGVASASATDLQAGRAVYWDAAGVHTLNGLSDASGSGANDLNDLGQIVGFSSDAQGRWQAVVWDQGTPTVLSPLAGKTSGMATKINAKGQVIGYSGGDDNGDFVSTVWLDGMALAPDDLLSLADREAGWHIDGVIALNDNSWMLAGASNDKLHFNGLVALNPTGVSGVPESGTSLLMALGLLGMGAAVRRHRAAVSA